MKWADKSILVVDDSPLIRAMVTRALGERGFTQVCDADDGLSAKGLLEERAFDMVLSDYDMPNMDGGQLLEWIKENNPATLVIMLSGQTDRNTVVKLMRHAENYIVKDEMQEIREELFFVIEDTFERHALREENRRLMAELQARDRRMRMELETARYLLDEILPRKVPASPVFEVKVINRHSNLIGGDYFQLFRFGADLYAILADIAGHGVPAALLVLTLKNALEKIVGPGRETNDILHELNRQLMTLFPESAYATVSCLKLTEATGRISYTNEFQNPILFVRKDGNVVELDNGIIKFMGIKIHGHNDGGQLPMLTDHLQLCPEERLFILTDGITELEGDDGGQFGMERVKEALSRTRALPLEESIKELYREAVIFCGNRLNDDITVVGIGMKGA